MTQTFTYRNAIDASPTFGVDLGGEVVRLGEEQGFTELAEHLQSGSSTIILDDPDGTVGNSGDAILGNQRFEVDEDDCAAPKIYQGFIGTRTYSRGDGSRPSLVIGSQRQISVELHDLNAIPSFRVIPQTNRDAIRPRETVSDRFAWIIGTGYVAYAHDNGLIASNTTMMDAMTGAGYRGQRPVNVINDCEMAAGFGWNCFIYWDDVAGEASWWFGNSNTSTEFSSTLRISNDPGDCDTLTVASFESGTTFAPMRDGVLTRDPTELGDSDYLPYKNGAVFRTRASTTATYGQKDLVAPNANVGSKARAIAIADDFLYQHRNEEDRITCTVELPTSKVNLIKAGHRIEVKFRHLPGYESFTWCRVLRRTVGQRQKTKARYQVELELSPQEGGNAPIFVQDKHVATAVAPQLTMDHDVTIGNVLISAMVAKKSSGDHGLPEMLATGGWTLLGSAIAGDANDVNGWGTVAVYAKVATSTSPIIDRSADSARTQFHVYEIARAAIGDVDALSLSHQGVHGVSVTADLGSFTSPGFGVWVGTFTRQDAGHAQGITSAFAAGWTEDWDAEVDPSATAQPWVAMGHTTVASDTGINPSVGATETVSGEAISEWAGVAVRFI